MAKRQALLFELMKEGDQPESKKSLWDSLFRRSEPAKIPDEFDQSENSTSASTGFQTTPSLLQAGDDEYEDSDRTRIYMCINTFSIVLVATAVLVLFFCGYFLGRQTGYNRGTEIRSDAQLAAVASDTPDMEVLGIPPVKLQEQPKDNNLITIGKKTRKEGLNYLIIESFREQADAERAREFLASKGIEATVERKDPWFQLVSLDGFDLRDTEQKRRSEQFQSQIRAWGEQYRQQREAKGVSFRTCYYARWPI